MRLIVAAAAASYIRRSAQGEQFTLGGLAKIDHTGRTI